jgi:hypothetical protein
MAAKVAELQRVPDGILFRVINVDEFGIVYVLRFLDGTLRAERFHGQRLLTVPLDAYEAVTRYMQQQMPELLLRTAQLTAIMHHLAHKPGSTSFALARMVPNRLAGQAAEALLGQEHALILMNDLLGELQQAGKVRSETATKGLLWYLTELPGEETADDTSS